MSKGEGKHNKTKKNSPKSPTKKETLLEASCISKKSFYDNPIMSEKAQQKAPEASVQQGFHCSCFARNENLAIICCPFSRSLEGLQKAHSFASFGLCVGFVRLANVCACVLGQNGASSSFCT